MADDDHIDWGKFFAEHTLRSITIGDLPEMVTDMSGLFQHFAGTLAETREVKTERPKNAFGKHKHSGTSGASLLTLGVQKRARNVDPHTVLEVTPPKAKPRRVRLRKEPLGE